MDIFILGAGKYNFMANLRNISFRGDEIEIVLGVSKEEYEALAANGRECLVLPVRGDSMQETLTSGKLGTGNRIMVPNKLLAKHSVEKLKKKLPARLFDFEEGKFILIRLEGPKLVPKFEEDFDEKE
jgi:hypothetical protein